MKPDLAKRAATTWASFASRHPIVCFLLGCLVLAAAVPGFSRIVPNFTYTAYFWEDDPLRVQLESFSEQFGSDETVVIAVHSPSGIFDPESAELMRSLTRDLWQVPDVIRVDSLANVKLIEASEDSFEVDDVFPVDQELTPSYVSARQQAVLDYPLLVGSVVSEDLTIGTAVAYMRPLPAGTLRDADKVAAAARELVDKYSVGDHDLHLFGVPVLSSTFKGMAENDAPRMRMMATITACVALLVLFRRVSGVVIPMLLVGASVVATVPMAGWLGVEITTLSAGIITLLLAVCLTISVHVLSRFYYYLWTGVERREAVRLTLEENFLPTLLTAATTAVAFFACMSSELKIVAGFGLLGGVGTLLAWLLTFLMAPLMLRWFPLWKGGRGPRVLDPEQRMEPSGRALAYVAWLRGIRHPLVVVSVVLMVVGALAASQARVATNPLLTLEEDHEVRQSAEFMLEKMGMLTFELVVETGEPDGVKSPELLSKVEALQASIAEHPQVTSVMSVVDILKQVNRVLHGGEMAEYRLAETQQEIAQQLFLYTLGLPQGVSLSDRVTVDNDALRVSVASRVLISDDHIRLVQMAEKRAEELGLSVYATGLNHIYQTSSIPIVKSVLRSMMVALVGIGALLGIALRSVRLVTVAMVVNIVPLGVGATAFWLLGRPFDPGTVLSFSLALGIAVDDTVHIVVHYLDQAREGHPPDRALARVLTHVAPALFTTTAILLGSALVYLLGSYVPSFWFGVLLATILTSALAADLTLLPALFLILGDRVSERR